MIDRVHGLFQCSVVTVSKLYPHEPMELMERLRLLAFSNEPGCLDCCYYNYPEPSQIVNRYHPYHTLTLLQPLYSKRIQYQ
jgi:hypothetical protein